MVFGIPLFLVSLLLVSACTSEPDLDKLRMEILDLHKASLRAHLDKDVDFFVTNLSDDYFSAGNGKIRRPGKQEIYSQFNNYLSRTAFSHYQDVETPLVGFSDDGTLAWCLVRVKVAGKQKMDVDSVSHFNTTWSWITLYKREGDTWLRLGEVSSHD